MTAPRACPTPGGTLPAGARNNPDKRHRNSGGRAALRGVTKAAQLRQHWLEPNRDKHNAVSAGRKIPWAGRSGMDEHRGHGWSRSLVRETGRLPDAAPASNYTRRALFPIRPRVATPHHSHPLSPATSRCHGSGRRTAFRCCKAPGSPWSHPAPSAAARG